VFWYFNLIAKIVSINDRYSSATDPFRKLTLNAFLFFFPGILLGVLSVAYLRRLGSGAFPLCLLALVHKLLSTVFSEKIMSFFTNYLIFVCICSTEFFFFLVGMLTYFLVF
jgi:hypothetical protein